MTDTERTTRFIITPNHSMSLRDNGILFLSLLGVSCMIASGFAWHGMWLIAPISGLEMLCVMLAFYLCWRRSNRKEIVEITSDTIAISVGTRRPERSCVLRRAWAHVVFSQQRNHQPGRLWIRVRGVQVEVGLFLNAEEKRLLATRLRQSLHASR